MASKLMNRNFFLLWQGQLVSYTGTQLFSVTLLLWIAAKTNSAALVGAVVAAATIPGIIMAPLGGVIADRHSRRLILAFTDVVRGCALLGLGAELYFGSRLGFHMGVIFALSILVGCATAVFQPTGASFVPELVPRERLVGANSLIQSSFQIASLGAQAIGGILFRILGAPLLAVVDGVTYLYSAFSDLLIKPPSATSRAGANGNGTLPAKRSVLRELGEAIRYVRSRPGIRMLFLLGASLRFFLVPFTVLFPFYVADRLHASSDWFGFITAGMAAGTVVGSVLSTSARAKGNAVSYAILICLLIMSASLGGLSLVSVSWQALVLVSVAGVMNGFLNVNLVTILQLNVPAEMQGRVLGVLKTVTDGLAPVAMIVAGFIADLTGRNVPAIYLGCGLAMALLSILLAGRKESRSFFSSDTATVAAKGVA
jgi:MFS family permease